MPFFEKNTGYSNESDEDVFGNRIIILKKVKSLKQLRRTEKELVRLNYKEAIIKGFTLKGIQQYIATKTKIWIEWSGIEYLKKAEEQENREWYYYMARDHFVYIGAYRKCIDEIEQLKKEMWNIIMDSKAEMYSRIQATRELHSLSKTSVLLLRDLPFVANLSKFYDLSNLYNALPNKSSSISMNNNNNEIFNETLKIRANKELKSSADNKFDWNFNKDKKLDNGIKDNGKSPNKYKNLDDEIFEDMQRQIHLTDSLKGKNIEEITDEDMDMIITPEHKESVRKLQELLDD